MVSPHSVFQSVLPELRDFDWHQVLNPMSVGRWPVLPRMLALLTGALVITGLIFTASHFLGPHVSLADQFVVTTMKEKIGISQSRNAAAAARQLESGRRSFAAYALLQQETSEVTDITQTMEIIRSTALVSDMQLRSVDAEFHADEHQAVMTVNARVTLPSLASFWQRLSQAAVDFSIVAMELERGEKPDIFEVSMGLAAQVAADVGPSTLWTGEPESDAAEDKAEYQKRKDQKGFIVRAGSSQLLYLVRNEKGRLASVEK